MVIDKLKNEPKRIRGARRTLVQQFRVWLDAKIQKYNDNKGWK